VSVEEHLRPSQAIQWSAPNCCASLSASRPTKPQPRRHDGLSRRLRRWAAREAIHHQARGDGPDLYWWEVTAFALIAAATDSAIRPRQVSAIDRAYFPWIGAVNSLLDSLIDHAEDAGPGKHGLLDYYDSAEQLAARRELIADEAHRRARAVDYSGGHTLILAARMSFYLTQAKVRRPRADSFATACAPAQIGSLTDRPRLSCGLATSHPCLTPYTARRRGPTTRFSGSRSSSSGNASFPPGLALQPSPTWSTATFSSTPTPPEAPPV